MPFVYHTPAFSASTSGTPNTELDTFTWKPGTRDLLMHSVTCGGSANAATAINGLAVRIKKYTSTASSATTPFTLVPLDPGAQAAKSTCGFVIATPGTGGPLYLGGFVCSAGGPGGWKARTDDQAIGLEGSANQSLDLWTAAPTASLQAAYDIDVME